MWWYELPAWLAAALFFPWEYAKRPPERRRAWARQRWALDRPSTHDVWIHAVSVGECLSALPVIRSLESARPGLRIALSTVTDTGYGIASGRLAGHTVFYMPWDIPGLLRRTFRSIRPKVLVIMETEIWPGLMAVAAKEGVPVLLVNGRISDRSFRRYLKIRFIMNRVLKRFSVLGMQSETDRERIVAMGAPEDRALNLGNIKYDLAQPSVKGLEWMDRISSPLLVAGSTHEGEEKGIVEMYRSLVSRGEDLRLLIVPRHPERFDAVERTITEAGFQVIRRSSIPDSQGPNPGARQILLVDRMGELADIYGRSDIVFLGGSLVPVGGHNILEAALWRKPVLVGPHMENFRDITLEFLQAGGLIQVGSFAELETQVEALLHDTQRRKDTGDRAFRILERNRGASQRGADLIGRYLENPSHPA